ncbi:MAG: glutathione S-transferase family protein, partial [Pseudomonadales bacterium]
CLPEAFFGQTVSDEIKESTKKDLAKGMRAVGNLLGCNPYAAGETFTLADLYVFYTFGLASGIVKKVFDEDLMAEVPELKGLVETLANRDSIREVEAAKVR